MKNENRPWVSKKKSCPQRSFGQDFVLVFAPRKNGFAAQKSGDNIVEKQKRKTENVNAQIQRRLGKNVVRCADEPHERVVEKHADSRQQNRKENRRPHRSGDGGFHFSVFLGAEQPRNDHGTADVAFASDGNEDHGDGIGTPTAARAACPANLPTITLSARAYICWKRTLRNIGAE